MRKIIILSLLLPLLASCLKEDEVVDYAIVDEGIISEYLAENGIDAERDPSGLYYEIIEMGDGAPIGEDITKDDKITFSLKGYLTSGKVFADTEGENITGYLSPMLYGFRIGIPKVNREGRINLFIPSGLAYGANSSASVPANSVVIFEIDVKRDQADIDEDILAAYIAENQINAERDESGLYYEIIEPGEGDNVPDNASVSVSYKGTLLNGEVFDENTLSSYPLYNLIEAWQVGIPKLKKGGKAIFYCPSQMAYGSDVKESIPANSILIFEVEVINFF
ncbi:FKBP-type peptidyl-prolyl cis-trans isomerase [Carboxylicivirga sp. N1Y90]|uniref:FKBP-type peptidyl-prolyl cis-trans isomerase n=1 Tax=Carboxylicivirga fragile TaxID=3417571 RepID=UPI003D32CF4F|nr:FKBP-type peptidyl-prolyl cis-trans isomerase [Marinilabiliaceae bacterium N1Y90]